MSAAEKLDLSPIDEALARFADGTATRADVVTLVEHCKAINRHRLAVTVIRTKPWRRGGTIRLMSKAGPFSSEDCNITRVNPRQVSAWWEVDALEYWLEHHR